MNKKYNKYLFLILMMFIVLCGVFIYRSRSARDATMERKLSKSIMAFRDGKTKSLDLRTVLGDKWEEVCIQTCYEPQENFEKRIGRKVEGFEMPGDTAFILWVFDHNGVGRWAEINRLNIMDVHPGRGDSCTKLENPYLYAEEVNGERKYYFYTEKK